MYHLMHLTLFSIKSTCSKQIHRIQSLSYYQLPHTGIDRRIIAKHVSVLNLSMYSVMFVSITRLVQIRMKLTTID